MLAELTVGRAGQEIVERLHIMPRTVRDPHRAHPCHAQPPRPRGRRPSRRLGNRPLPLTRARQRRTLEPQSCPCESPCFVSSSSRERSLARGEARCRTAVSARRPRAGPENPAAPPARHSVVQVGHGEAVFLRLASQACHHPRGPVGHALTEVCGRASRPPHRAHRALLHPGRLLPSAAGCHPPAPLCRRSRNSPGVAVSRQGGLVSVPPQHEKKMSSGCMTVELAEGTELLQQVVHGDADADQVRPQGFARRFTEIGDRAGARGFGEPGRLECLGGQYGTQGWGEQCRDLSDSQRLT